MCLHPQLMQQHINRSQKRLARMKGIAPPSKREMEERISKRMFIPKGGRPKNVKRYNRLGMPKVEAAVADIEDAVEDIELSVFAKGKGRKGKGKSGQGAGANGAGAGVDPAASLTAANPPTANNSLGLDIEYVSSDAYGPEQS